MHSTLASAALLGFSALAAAAPASSPPEVFDFPLSNGFPNLTASDPATLDIEKAALGTLSNAPPPKKGGANDTSINDLAFVAFNELFEVAFFTELIQNITTNATGFTPADIAGDRNAILEILKVHQADEELHELNANGAFNALTGGRTILPCEYVFPVHNFNESIGLASMFTDVVMSTLPDIQTTFAVDGDTGLIRGIGAVLGQEGEQNGFYRAYLGLPPAGLPFDTQGAVDFAFNAIVQNFVVPGSCSQLFDFQNPPFGVGRTLFNTLKVDTDASEFVFDKDITAKFIGIPSIAANNITSIPASASSSAASAQPTANQLLVQPTQEGIYMTYLNQVNKPVSVPVTVTRGDNGNTNFEASFPAHTDFLSGLVIAAITNTNSFASPDDVAAATLYGPALIEVSVTIEDLIMADTGSIVSASSATGSSAYSTGSSAYSTATTASSASFTLINPSATATMY